MIPCWTDLDKAEEMAFLITFLFSNSLLYFPHFSLPLTLKETLEVSFLLQRLHRSSFIHAWNMEAPGQTGSLSFNQLIYHLLLYLAEMESLIQAQLRWLCFPYTEDCLFQEKLFFTKLLITLSYNIASL
jgi:hypothetical protein